MKKKIRYSQEVRERAVRMVLEDFGLTKDTVRADFQTYIQRFNVAAAG